MTQDSGEFRFSECTPQADRQRNEAETGGEINAVQHGDQNLQKTSQAQHLHLYRADADEVIARLRSELDQALMQIGRSEHHSEMLTQQLAAAETRVAELEQELQLSRRREPAARRRLIASLRTSFDKIEKRKITVGFNIYTHRIHYSCHATHDHPISFVYQCKNVDLFLRKAYDLANTDPLDLMHFLVTLEPFPTQSVEIKGDEAGYCIKEIDNYVARLHQAVSQYFDALDGQ